MSVFRVGDEVEWTSQSNGSHTTKKGVVFAVIAPGNRARTVVGMKAEAENRIMFGVSVRKSESYVVKVSGKPGNSMPALYWPIVSALRISGATTQPPVSNNKKITKPMLDVLEVALVRASVNFYSAQKVGGTGATLSALVGRGLLIKREHNGSKFWEITSEGKAALKMYEGDEK